MAARPSTAVWTDERDLVAQVQRLWDRGVLLGCRLDQSVMAFPHQLRLRAPTSQDLIDRFDEARAWVGTIGGLADVGYDVRWRTINHRTLGRNELPHKVLLPDGNTAIALLGQTATAARFDALVARTHEWFPALEPWLVRKPLVAMQNEAWWGDLLAVVRWLAEHPNPGLYLRQIDLPGIDTKFVEQNRKILAELIDIAAPDLVIAPDAVGVRRFEDRYGFRSKPRLVRFRSLDDTVNLLGLPGGSAGTDITLDDAGFAALDGPGAGVTRVIVVENETNYLAFPDVQEAMVVWGAGFGLERLAAASWLERCRIQYWGDVDTNGFMILDEMRKRFGHVESFLMDATTFEAHKPFWTTEPSQYRGDLDRLNPAELALYDSLRFNRIQPNLRLEQERIRFGWLRAALSALSA